jgi:hypothetical protein
MIKAVHEVFYHFCTLKNKLSFNSYCKPQPANMNLKNLHQLSAVKLLFMSAVFLSSSHFTFGQTHIAVAPTKMNVLYIGIDNPVSVAASAGNDEKVTVAMNGGGGVVSKIGTGLYNVRVSDITDDCQLKVYVDGKLAGTSTFRVRRLPTPVGTVGGFSSGSNVNANAFRLQAGLGLYVKDFPFEIKYEVLGFTLTVDDDKGNIHEAVCKGGQFSSQAKHIIEQYVKPGRLVTIDAILARDEGGRELRLPSLVYYIK